INYVIYGGFKFFQRREIKDALAYLRMITASDDLSFLRVINTPRRSVGKKRITFIKNKAEEEGLSYYDVLKKYINDSIFNRTESKEFLEVIEEYKSKYKNMSVSMLLKELLDKTGYDQFLREDGDQDRIDNVSELFNSIVTYEQSAGEDVN